MKIIRKYSKPIAAFFILNFLFEIFLPNRILALTGHDSMPEYRSFEPVTTTDMVNLFDGSFTYNIPLLEVPNGYPISLSYHSSDVTNEAMASWVGLGWTINPGTINRAKRGFPDEFKGKSVTYHNRMPANWTISGTPSVGIEFFGDEGLMNASVSGTARYNNYNGIGTAVSANVGFAGVANLNFDHSIGGGYGFNANINPAAILNVAEKFKNRKTRRTGYKNLNTKSKEYFTSMRARFNAIKKQQGSKKSSASIGIGGFGASTGSLFSASTNSPVSYPSTLTQYQGFMAAIKVDVGVNIFPIPVDPEVGMSLSYARQKNIPEETKSVYGYMYNEEALSDRTKMMDYFTENEKAFEKRDLFLGYPLPNNDLYSMSGEAMGGSFRPLRAEFGHYRKNYVRSDDISVKVGGDLNIASVTTPIPPVLPVNQVYSYGVDVGGDYHYTNIGAWDNLGDAEIFCFKPDNFYTNSNEKFFFRFSGDKAGYFDLNGLGSFANNPFRAELDKTVIWANIDFDNSAQSYRWNGNREIRSDYRSKDKQKKRSTYISYHLNKDFADVVTKSVNGNNVSIKYKVFEKNLWVATQAGADEYIHTSYDEDDAIGEIVTYNTDGVTYVYGLPVYSRNEKELQYSLNSSDYQWEPGAQGYVANINSFIDGSAKRKIGFESNNQYASTYLITQVLSPEYLDRSGNGPTPDDFGSYTRFNYFRQAGGTNSSDDWYTYRTPYKGLSFSHNSLSSKDDDMGSLSYGQKEVYYLQSIASKTHVAVFTLNNETLTTRGDGQSAKLLPTGSSSIEAIIKGEDASADKMELRSLKKIDLYSINDCEYIPGSNIYRAVTGAVPIKTVHFEYTNELCPGIPNGTSGGGKLTLKKVWFEYGGKAKSKISPYVFYYEYPQSDNSANLNYVHYPATYDGLEDYMSSAIENPAYNITNTDRWGSYRSYAGLNGSLGSLSIFWPYVHQVPPATYDPAAYCLKRIVLPSGGEIHVQYEQNDYQYVQDKNAMIMVPLLSGVNATISDESSPNNKKYYIDLSKIGVQLPASDADKIKLADELFKPMRYSAEENERRIFFSFLYALIGDSPNYRYTHSDYIEGYARINGYGYDNYGIYFTFKSDQDNSPAPSYYRQLSYSTNASMREMPQRVCKDFYKTQRRGKITNETNALDNSNETSGSEDLGKAFISLITNFAENMDEKCREFDPAMSYVRLQVPTAMKKLGGGVRVRRLLMYDAGVDKNNPSPVLYGNEYSYVTTDAAGNEISSGVATNEPGVGRRECALVNPLPKDEQSKASAILHGRDMYNQEGPVGESLLPSPSIGYSKVTVNNIHSGKTSTGYETHEFYTAKDFPFIADQTDVDRINDYPLSIGASVAGVTVSYSRKAPYLAQGYVFKMYDMHGKTKSISKYANNSTTAYFSESYEYFGDNETVKVMGENLAVKNVSVQELGRETEILSELRQVTDYTFGGNIGVDVSPGVFVFQFLPYIPPVPIPVGMSTSINGGGFVSEQIFRTHVTSKIINYPALVKSVTRNINGIIQKSENIVFDDNTGNPVVVKTYDDFNGAYYDQSIMASWKYKNMNSKYKNENCKFGIASGGATYYLNNNNPYIEFTPSANTCTGILDNFTKGDFIQLNNTGVLFHVKEVDLINNRIYILMSMLSNNISDNTAIANISILRSGYSNQLSLQAGNIRYHVVDKDAVLSMFQTDGNMLDATNGFVADLNAVLENVIIDPSSPYMDYDFTLTGPYNGLNLSHYYNFDSNCTGMNISNVNSIQNVVISSSLSGTALFIRIVSFDIYCPYEDEWVTINCADPS